MGKGSQEWSLIFDIDGTLIDSFRVAGEEYKRAILSVLPGIQLKPNWRDYQNVTDSGIILEALKDNNAPHEPAETLRKIEEVFMKNITQRLEQTPCAEIMGARSFLEACRRNYEKVGIATGCWRDSGRVKLETAGYKIEGLPLASSSDHDTREGILKKALTLLQGDPERVIYFGDAEWDLKTTRNLGWRFIGIGEKLKGACDHWFPDYSDQDQILQVIERL